MSLKPLKFDENALTREDLLRIKGGATADYTITGCTGCSDTGTSTNPDSNCTDGCTKD